MTSTPLKKDTQYSRIQIRRDESTAWTNSVKPYATLLEGEIGLETDTGKFKIGDGVTLWADLPYWDRNGGRVIMSEMTPIEADFDIGQLWFALEANELRILVEDQAGVKTWSVVSIPISNQDDFNNLSISVDTIENRMDNAEERLMAIQRTLIDGVWNVAADVSIQGSLKLTGAGGASITEAQDVKEISFNKKDTQGFEFEFDQIHSGCYIRIGDPVSGAIYTYEKELTATPSMVRIEVDFVRSDVKGVVQIGTTVGVAIMGGGGTGVDVDAVRKAGDVMTGGLVIDLGTGNSSDDVAMNCIVNNVEFVTAYAGGEIHNGVGDGNNVGWNDHSRALVNRHYCNTHYLSLDDVDFVSKQGDDVKDGSLSLDKGQLEITPKSGSNPLLISDQKGDQVFSVDEDGRAFSKFVNPVDPQHLTTYKFVQNYVKDEIDKALGDFEPEVKITKKGNKYYLEDMS